MAACRIGLVLCGLLELACSKPRENEAVPKPSANVRTTAAVPSAAASARPAAPTEPPLDEAGVRALLDRWLSAQNGGDFKAYQELYAPRFTGVKRSGSYSKSFDRKGWLRDREGMFTRPMQVSTEQVELHVTPSTARITLQQTWASGTYRDIGPKQIVVVSTTEGPRIAREEMLSSRIVGNEGRAGVSDLLLLGDDGVILHTNPDDAWANGPIKPGANENVALRAVNEAALPAELRAWKERGVRTMNASGSACESKIAEFFVRAEVVPHFGMRQSWSGQDGDPKLDRAQIAEQIWQLAESGGRTLVARLEPSCKGLWALDAARTPPIAAAPQTPAPELLAAALRSFRALPAYAKLQSEFIKTAATPKGRWEEYTDANLQVVVFRAAGYAPLVSVFARSGNGCGDFEGSLSALYRLRNETRNELELLDQPAAASPTTAFDLEGDGSLELLYDSSNLSDETLLWRKTAKGPALDTLFAVPFLDCPC